MKKFVVLFGCLLLTIISVESLNAQGQAMASAETSGNVIVPISITKTQDLVFGNIVPTAVAGTVVIAPDGTRLVTGGVLTFANSTGNPQAAVFNVSGEPNALYSITVPAGSFNVSSGSNTMEVWAFTTLPGPNGVLSGAGAQTINVGATLNVNLNQPSGFYTNADALTITVAYN